MFLLGLVYWCGLDGEVCKCKDFIHEESFRRTSVHPAPESQLNITAPRVVDPVYSSVGGSNLVRLRGLESKNMASGVGSTEPNYPLRPEHTLNMSGANQNNSERFACTHENRWLFNYCARMGRRIDSVTGAETRNVNPSRVRTQFMKSS